MKGAIISTKGRWFKVAADAICGLSIGRRAVRAARGRWT